MLNICIAYNAPVRMQPSARFTSGIINSLAALFVISKYPNPYPSMNWCNCDTKTIYNPTFSTLCRYGIVLVFG